MNPPASFLTTFTQAPKRAPVVARARFTDHKDGESHLPASASATLTRTTNLANRYDPTNPSSLLGNLTGYSSSDEETTDILNEQHILDRPSEKTESTVRKKIPDDKLNSSDRVKRAPTKPLQSASSQRAQPSLSKNSQQSKRSSTHTVRGRRTGQLTKVLSNKTSQVKAHQVTPVGRSDRSAASHKEKGGNRGPHNSKAKVDCPAMKKRAASSLVPRANAKRPKVVGGFIDDSDEDSGSDNGTNSSSNQQSVFPFEQADDQEDYDSIPENSDDRRQKLFGSGKTVASTSTAPTKGLNREKVKALMREKERRRTAGRSGSSNFSRGHVAPSTIGMKQTVSMAQGSTSGTPAALKPSVPAARKALGYHTGFSGDTRQPIPKDLSATAERGSSETTATSSAVSKASVPKPASKLPSTTPKPSQSSQAPSSMTTPTSLQNDQLAVRKSSNQPSAEKFAIAANVKAASKASVNDETAATTLPPQRPAKEIEASTGSTKQPPVGLPITTLKKDDPAVNRLKRAPQAPQIGGVLGGIFEVIRGLEHQSITGINVTQVPTVPVAGHGVEREKAAVEATDPKIRTAQKSPVNSSTPAQRKRPLSGQAHTSGSQPSSNLSNLARPLSSGHMSNILSIQDAFRKAHPDWSQEKVQKAASNYLQRRIAQQQQQRASKIAAGSSDLLASSNAASNKIHKSVRQSTLAAPAAEVAKSSTTVSKPPVAQVSQNQHTRPLEGSSRKDSLLTTSTGAEAALPPPRPSVDRQKKLNDISSALNQAHATAQVRSPATAKSGSFAKPTAQAESVEQEKPGVQSKPIDEAKLLPQVKPAVETKSVTQANPVVEPEATAHAKTVAQTKPETKARSIAQEKPTVDGHPVAQVKPAAGAKAAAQAKATASSIVTAPLPPVLDIVPASNTSQKSRLPNKAAVPSVVPTVQAPATTPTIQKPVLVRTSLQIPQQAFNTTTKAPSKPVLAPELPTVSEPQQKRLPTASSPDSVVSLKAAASVTNASEKLPPKSTLAPKHANVQDTANGNPQQDVDSLPGNSTPNRSASKSVVPSSDSQDQSPKGPTLITKNATNGQALGTEPPAFSSSLERALVKKPSQQGPAKTAAVTPSASGPSIGTEIVDLGLLKSTSSLPIVITRKAAPSSTPAISTHKPAPAVPAPIVETGSKRHDVPAERQAEPHKRKEKEKEKSQRVIDDVSRVLGAGEKVEDLARPKLPAADLVQHLQPTRPTKARPVKRIAPTLIGPCRLKKKEEEPYKPAAASASPKAQPAPPMIFFRLPHLPAGAEPYFEFSIHKKMWKHPQTEEKVVASELTSNQFTNIEEANAQADKFFNVWRQEIQQHFQSQCDEWIVKRDKHDCKTFLVKFSPLMYPDDKNWMKMWVQRDEVSVHAGGVPKEMKHSSFVAKSIYAMRLFELVPTHEENDSDGEDAMDTDDQMLRVYHPIEGTSLFTTLDAANRAAHQLQIKLGFEEKPKTNDVVWQKRELKKLKDYLERLSETNGCWEREFNGSGLGSKQYELEVKRESLCGPRNL